ncbi:MAG: CBS domain-containing protein [Methylophilales bacterium]|nr:CBS domain-containing protein [Methylophilales bacterium]
MFMLYGIPGQTYVGKMESLNRVEALSRTSAVRKVMPKSTEFDVELAHNYKPHEDAIKAYKALVQPDVERGPLYHAYQIMSRKVITLQDDDDVAAAWQIFRTHRIHEAPVLNTEQKLVGIVSERDLLTTIDIKDGKVIDSMHKKVRDVMITPVVAAEPVTDIRRIATVMMEHGVDGVPIVNDGHELVGFISRTDILRSVVTDPPLSLWR